MNTLSKTARMSAITLLLGVAALTCATAQAMQNGKKLFGLAALGIAGYKLTHRTATPKQQEPVGEQLTNEEKELILQYTPMIVTQINMARLNAPPELAAHFPKEPLVAKNTLLTAEDILSVGSLMPATEEDRQKARKMRTHLIECTKNCDQTVAGLIDCVDESFSEALQGRKYSEIILSLTPGGLNGNNDAFVETALATAAELLPVANAFSKHCTIVLKNAPKSENTDTTKYIADYCQDFHTITNAIIPIVQSEQTVRRYQKMAEQYQTPDTSSPVATTPTMSSTLTYPQVVSNLAVVDSVVEEGVIAMPTTSEQPATTCEAANPAIEITPADEIAMPTMTVEAVKAEVVTNADKQ
jgi:hypothetical protein